MGMAGLTRGQAVILEAGAEEAAAGWISTPCLRGTHQHRLHHCGSWNPGTGGAGNGGGAAGASGTWNLRNYLEVEHETRSS